MTSATLAEAEVLPAEWLRQVERALADVFGGDRSFQFWRPGERWGRVVFDDVRIEIIDAAAVSEDHQRRLNRVAASNAPEVFETPEGKTTLLVPILRYGQVVAVAESRFERCSVDLLTRLANAFLKYTILGAQFDRARQENETFTVQLTQDFEELTFLRSMTERLEVSDASFDLVQMAATAMPALTQSLRVEQIALVESGNDELANGESAHKSRQVGDVLYCAGEETISGELCKKLISHWLDQGVELPIAKNHFDESSSAAEFPGVRGFVLAPLVKSGQTLGWLLALNRESTESTSEGASRPVLDDNEFGTSEAALLCSAASILATHTVNVGLLREKERLLINVVRSLVFAIEAKDTYTCGHSERVALFGKRLAEACGLSETACERLYLTGLLHDVGKIGVRDATLQKPGRLTVEEFDEIKRHPDEGWSILHDLEQLRYVLPGVLYHHERIDGQGYPDGLAGEEIPLEGRILAVADAYDAMTSDRPYRQGLPQEKAEAILREGAAVQWDADLVDAFLRIMPEIVRIRDSYQPRQPAHRKPRGIDAVGESQ